MLSPAKPHSEGEMHPIVGLKLSEQLREQIEERIVIGEYAPGARLDESELANDFGVSRTPIREDLIQLASAGFVETRPRRGAVVATTPPERLREMFDVMGELEAACARLAATRAGPHDHRTLVAAHHACEPAARAGDPDAFYRSNEAFHLALYAASRNGFLAEQAALLHRRLRPYRRLQLRVPGRMKSSSAEHAAVVDAVLRGDEELAAARVRAHVQVQGDRFAALVARLAASGPPAAASGPPRRSPR
jgi:DNA-binding GntR family transcriptional regulator